MIYLVYIYIYIYCIYIYIYIARGVIVSILERGVEPLRGAGLASTLLSGAAALRCLASDYARNNLDSNCNILAALLRRACAAATVRERAYRTFA